MSEYILPVTLHGRKLQLPGPKPRELQNFIESLPNSRWWPEKNLHTCDATPATAWNILSHSPCDVSASDEVTELSHRFLRRYEMFEDTGEQPPVRVLDSWEHQRQAYWFAYHRDSALFNMWMGTGKSKPTVELAINKKCKRVIVLCPSAVLGVWRREFAQWGVPDSCRTLILDKQSWTSKRKAKEADQFLKQCEGSGKCAIIVINYESAWRTAFEKWSLGVHWNMAICDESQKIANANTNQSRYCAKLGMNSDFRLCLSGTPLKKDPLSVFGQFKFLDRGVFGTSWTRFRDRYGIKGNFGDNHIVGYKNTDELSDLISLLTFTVGQDALDLPPVLDIERPVEFDKKAMQTYKIFEQECVTSFGDNILSADNILVKLLRLQQMTSGMVPLDPEYVLGPGGEYEVVATEWEFISDAKRKGLLELLQDFPADEPFVVFCKFKQDLVAIREIAQELGRRYGEISGDRKDLTPDAKMPEGIDLMGVQIQSGGIGIDLTRACCAAYYSIGYSLDDFQQSAARLSRPGQTRPCRFWHLTVRDTIDELIYKTLERRQEINEGVLSYLKEKQQRILQTG
ncbi:hypothetical protein Pan241w_11690 [Gimesia alba]|uniref:Helicase ATP-binding domain-containing protein n=1 Tax=Gimesia alba TaxID=2527973 RepID=A0A517RB43_9PLAN|nr:DEAD/DEAH box helicase [Gimesia alba]QDT41110.1 hypothetical protein Pan241w_11690 [Gimesia alba]